MSTKRLVALILASVVIMCILASQPGINDCKSQKSLLDLSPNLRQQNYNGGSCVYASMCTVLVWQHREDLAAIMRNTYSGAASADALIRACEVLGIDYAFTKTADPGFLDWCDRTNRGAVIFYFPDHCVTFAGYSGNNALVIDNNSPGSYIKINKAQFLSDWKSYGGFALTAVYSPSPPQPRTN